MSIDFDHSIVHVELESVAHVLTEHRPKSVVVRIADAVLLGDVRSDCAAGIDGAAGCKRGEWMHLRIARCADNLVGVGLDEEMASHRAIVVERSDHVPRAAPAARSG